MYIAENLNKITLDVHDDDDEILREYGTGITANGDNSAFSGRRSSYGSASSKSGIGSPLANGIDHASLPEIIWDEVGESESDRDRMLFELEQECLEVYRRKVIDLRQAITDCEAELASICSSMGERPLRIRQTDQNVGSLKDEHARILPQLEEMQKRKSERRNQFIEVQEQIQSISIEIHGPREYIPLS
ncbi:Microtubule-associated protein [Vigna unguiculata]|uniref:Microtubule-associated protein n=1 Tax=Vigna unguiculata TaxID=3917 RepID=A0A4D6N1Q8_VIGUN|nr:Microtubule-associated protein [Vigna unguiculata]